MSNALTVLDYNAPTAYDSFDYDDDGSSPIRGVSAKFANGPYVAGRQKTPLDPTRRVVVTDKASGWQFLKKDCQPEWVMWTPGAERPQMPDCPEDTWPLGLDGKTPTCPWKWAYFLYCVDIDNGETITISGSTIGMKLAVDELSKQIRSMRDMRPLAMPIIELQSVMMPTKAWGERLRPFFKITNWRSRTTEELPPQISDDGRDYDAEFAEAQREEVF
jgi:hypothetical protein